MVTKYNDKINYKILEGHNFYINCIDISLDNSTIISGSYNAIVRHKLYKRCSQFGELLVQI